MDDIKGSVNNNSKEEPKNNYNDETHVEDNKEDIININKLLNNKELNI